MLLFVIQSLIIQFYKEVHIEFISHAQNFLCYAMMQVFVTSKR